LENIEDEDDDIYVSDETSTPTSTNDPIPPITVPSPRYPQRQRRRPGNWFTASAVHEKQLEITTSDDPSFKEILSSGPIEYDLWMKAIDEEFESLHEKNT